MIDVSFEDYRKVYAGVDSMEDYGRLLEQAAAVLRGLTARRIDDVTDSEDFRSGQVRSAIIYAVHELAEMRKSDGGVRSVSNDGYSETYAAGSELMDDMKAALKEILSGTGLTGCF